MRAKWMLLAKIQLMGLLGLNRARKTDDARVRRKAVGGAVAFGIVSLILLAYITLFAILLCEIGLTEAVPATAIALAAVITFFFSLLQGSSMLFSLKDHDAVMSLPVSRSAVIGSRLFVSYVVNLLFCLGVMLPVTVVYFVFAGFSVGKLAVIFAATLCAPLLPVVVATAIGTLLTALMAGLRIKGLLQGLFGLLFFAAIMVLSFAFSFSMQSPDAAGNMAAAADALARYVYPPAQWVSMTLSGEAVWGIFAFVGVSVAAAALFVLAVSPFYSKINAALLNRGARVAYKAGDVKSASAFASLLGREFRRLFTSSVYLLNGISGVLLLVLGGVALLFVDAQAFIDLLRAEAETEAPTSSNSSSKTCRTWRRGWSCSLSACLAPRRRRCLWRAARAGCCFPCPCRHAPSCSQRRCPPSSSTGRPPSFSPPSSAQRSARGRRAGRRCCRPPSSFPPSQRCAASSSTTSCPNTTGRRRRTSSRAARP